MRHETAARGGPHHWLGPLRLGFRFGAEPPRATVVKKKKIVKSV